MASIVTIQVFSLSGCHLDTLSMESTLLGADLIDIVLRRYRKDNAHKLVGSSFFLFVHWEENGGGMYGNPNT